MSVEDLPPSLGATVAGIMAIVAAVIVHAMKLLMAEYATPGLFLLAAAEVTVILLALGGVTYFVLGIGAGVYRVVQWIRPRGRHPESGRGEDSE